MFICNVCAYNIYGHLQCMCIQHLWSFAKYVHTSLVDIIPRLTIYKGRHIAHCVKDCASHTHTHTHTHMHARTHTHAYLYTYPCLIDLWQKSKSHHSFCLSFFAGCAQSCDQKTSEASVTKRHRKQKTSEASETKRHRKLWPKDIGSKGEYSEEWEGSRSEGGSGISESSRVGASK
jgi:hypothetical protein